MDFIWPKRVKRGDTVGVFAPSDWFSRGYFREGVEIIRSWGLNLKFGKNIYNKVEDFMAGSVEERIMDMREMIFDDEVSILWAADGGYAATEVRFALGKKEINHLRRKPKWMIGFSDTSVLSNALFAYGIPSVYGANVWGLSHWKKESERHLKKILFEGEVSLPAKGGTLIPGEARGLLLATNLDSLIANLGTNYDPILHGEGPLILALEDWKQEPSILSRQFDALFDHERFDRFAGVVLGRFSLIEEESYVKWGRKVEVGALVREKLLRRKKLPLVAVPYFGHPNYWNYIEGKKRQNNLALPSGLPFRLSASEKVDLSCLEKINP